MQTLLKIFKKFFKWLGIIIGSLLLLVVILILLLRTPWAQQKVVNYATSYVSDKTGTAVKLERLFVTFRGNVAMEGLYLEGLQRDTLLYSQSLEAGVEVGPLINGDIAISRVDWEGVRANIIRGNDSNFNFQFLIDSLAGGSSSPSDTATSAPADTSSSGSTNFSIGPVSLQKFNLSYLDSISGLDAQLDLGTLEITNESINLDSSIFKIDEIHLANTTARINQFAQAGSSEDDSSSSPLPTLSWNQILLEDLTLVYDSKPQEINSRAYVGTIALGESDLKLEQQELRLNSIQFKNSDIALQLPAPQATAEEPQPAADTAAGFTWPEWKALVQEVEFQNNNFSIHQGPKPEVAEATFNARHLEVNNFTLLAPEIALEKGKAELNLEKLSFSEGMQPAFRLNTLALNLQLEDEKASLTNLQLLTGRTTVRGSLQLSYPSVSALMENPQQALNFQLDLNQADVSISDAYYFNDSLQYQPFAEILEDAQPRLTTQVSGSVADLNIAALELSAFEQTNLNVSGHIKGLPNIENLQVNIPNLQLKTTKSDLANVIDTASSLNPPAYITLNASARGNAQKLTSQLKVNSAKGAVLLSAVAENIASKRPVYQGKLQLKQLEVGNIINNPQLGTVALKANFDGAGTAPENLTLTTDIDFSKLEFKGYDYAELKAEVKANRGKYDVALSHEDKNLAMQLKANAELDSLDNHVAVDLNLRGADLTDLNLAQHPRKLSMVMKASYDGRPEDFIAQLSLDDVIMIGADGSTYRSDTAFVGVRSQKDTSALLVNSPTLSGEMVSNTSINTTFSTMQSFIMSTLGRDTTNRDSVNNKINMQAYFKVHNTPLLSDVLLPGLQRMDSITLQMAFKPKKDLLRVNLRVPDLLYSGVELEQLALDLNANSDTLGLNLNYDHLRTGPVDMYKTSLSATAGDGPGSGYLQVHNEEGGEVMYLAADIGLNEMRQRYFSLQNDKLILNGKSWSAPEDNRLTLTEQGPDFQNFKISRQNKSLVMESSNEQSRLSMLFKNFKLQAFLSIFNPEKPLLGGSVNGEIELEKMNNNAAFTADVQIDSLAALNNYLGVLQLQAENTSATAYDGNLLINGPELVLQANGDYSTSGNESTMQANVNLQKLGLALVQKFTPDNLQKASGFLNGQFEISGPVSDIQYEGALNFMNILIKPTYLGTPFTLNNEKISISNEEISFERFTIKDDSGDPFSIDGKISTSSFTNPEFDLKVKAQNFEILDVTKENNKTFSGQAAFNLEADITGDLVLPKVKARFELLKPTNVFYNVSPSQASIDSREGLVRFVNVQDTLEVLNTDEDTPQNLVTGYDIDARILADPETRITIYPDPRSNDLITVQGEANLNYHLFPNGNMTMVGDYELSDGAYKLSLYELIKKRFNIQDGSRIVWTGDPMAAELDITALYETKAAPVDLMSNQLAGADQATINRYKQQLTFLVQLFISGTINEPDISFGLEMPEEARAALGGSVYSRVQQINNDESELNKQVFSLIAFNRFLPSGVGGGSDGGTTEGIARSSVSRILSSQLNRLSEQYIEGVELNFDLDSYKDYQSGQAQQRTDLNISLRKSFLDERLVIEVGSQVGVEGEGRGRSQVLSDVKVEYLLTEDGRYRLEAFQENEYEGIIEGQVRITGLGILFSREFNNWQDLMEGNDEADESEEEPQDMKGKDEEEVKPKNEENQDGEK